MRGTIAPHTETIEIWVSIFKLQFGIPYMVSGGRDGAAVKAMLKLGLAPGEISELALAAWNAPQGPKFWNCNNRSKTLCDFASALNKIRLEVQQLKPRNMGGF